MATRSPPQYYIARTFKVLRNYTPTLTEAVFNKRGFYDTCLIHDWPNIIGSPWATSTFPEKLSRSRMKGDGSVLHIRATSSDAFLLRHVEPQLIERINSYFGYPVVTRLRFIHDPSVMRSPASEQPLASNPQQFSPSILADNKDLNDLSEPLKNALAMLNDALAKPRK